jgi:hypothetical protein
MQAPVDYVVTVTIAGQRETFEGTFEPTETGEAGWREVTRFTAE